MLLNPNDYEYEYFNQPRGRDGDSGPIYLGRPKKDGLCKILVKDNYVSDAINEFIACNIGSRIGVNTPQAWLFEQDVYFGGTNIHFENAIGMEYLDGLVELKQDSYYVEGLETQGVQGILLHLLMSDDDGISLGRCGNKVYAFDFATSLYHSWANRNIPPRAFTDIMNSGLSRYETHIANKEKGIRWSISEYIESLEPDSAEGKVALSVYEEMKNHFVEQYNETGFEDIIDEIDKVFSRKASQYARDLLVSMDHALVYAFNSDHVRPATKLYIGQHRITQHKP